MRLTPEALASVLPKILKNSMDHTSQDKALAEAAVALLMPEGSPKEAGALKAAADLARDFRLLCLELEQ